MQKLVLNLTNKILALSEISAEAIKEIVIECMDENAVCLSTKVLCKPGFKPDEHRPMHVIAMETVIKRILDDKELHILRKTPRVTVAGKVVQNMEQHEILCMVLKVGNPPLLNS